MAPPRSQVDVAESGIVLIKKFDYRGSNEEWSNVYHFSETPPSGDTAWKALVDALAAKEKAVYPSNVHIVRAYCYYDTDNDAVSSVDYTALGAEIPGTLSTAGGILMPGDDACWIRWATTKMSSKGKRVYLRKYFHGVLSEVGIPDGVLTSQKTALTTLGNALRGGAGAITGFTFCGHDGTAAGTVAVSQFVTTRTLKRRGKRPPT